MPVRILVCTDGEWHSNRAIQRAIYLGLTLPAAITALHVIDPFLKKFYNELYSQGRRRYLEYVDERLQADADQARREFTRMCLVEGLKTEFKVRHGEPLREILEELRVSAPDLLITGGKPLNAWGRFRSRNLPLQLQRKTDTPMSIIVTAGFSAPCKRRNPGLLSGRI